jgi:hypothetical protein
MLSLLLALLYSLIFVWLHYFTMLKNCKKRESFQIVCTVNNDSVNTNKLLCDSV